MLGFFPPSKIISSASYITFFPSLNCPGKNTTIWYSTVPSFSCRQPASLSSEVPLTCMPPVACSPSWPCPHATVCTPLAKSHQIQGAVIYLCGSDFKQGTCVILEYSEHPIQYPTRCRNHWLFSIRTNVYCVFSTFSEMLRGAHILMSCSDIISQWKNNYLVVQMKTFRNV